MINLLKFEIHFRNQKSTQISSNKIILNKFEKYLKLVNQHLKRLLIQKI